MSLNKTETYYFLIKDKHIFSNLLSFVAYYRFIIEFYNKNIENIIAVKELLLLKYIDMVNNILTEFEGTGVDISKKEHIEEMLKSMNDRLFTTVKDIKERGEMNFAVDIRTMEDLINSDF